MMNRIHVVHQWTLISIGFSDMAEAFAFLSGYMFGRSFRKRIVTDGLCSCIKRATRRSAQIYVAYLATLVVILSCGYRLQSAVPELRSRLFLQSSFADQMFNAMLLLNQHSGFVVLGFYVVLLPFASVFAWLLLHRRSVAWVISLVLYVLGQYLQNTAGYSHLPQSGVWGVNLLSWQFLYFIGLAFGTKNVCPPDRRAAKAVAIVFSIAMIALGLVVMKSGNLSSAILHLTVQDILERYPGLVNKSPLGPLRLLHFAGIAYPVSLLARKFPRFAEGWPAEPAVMIGQSPLLVYCTGLFLTHASIGIWQNFGRSTASVVWLHLDLILVLLAVVACSRLMVSEE